jgi:hypothetical protein
MHAGRFFAALTGLPDFKRDPGYLAACRWADDPDRFEPTFDSAKIAAVEALAQQSAIAARGRCDLLTARLLEIVKVACGLATALIAAAVALKLTGSWAVRGSMICFVLAAVSSLGSQVAPLTAAFPDFRTTFEKLPDVDREKLWLAVSWFLTLEGLRVHAEWLANRLAAATLLMVLGIALLIAVLF